MRTTMPRVSLFKRSNSPYWYLRITSGGTRRRVATGLRDKEECRRVAKALQAQLVAQHYGLTRAVSSGNASLRDVLNLYRARLVEPRVSHYHAVAQHLRLNRVEKHFGATTPAMDIKTDVVDRWITKRFKDGVSKTTIHGEYVALRCAYRMALEADLIPKIPFKNRAPKPVIVKDTLIPEDDLRKILDGLDPADHVDRVILLAAFTGLRQGDILSLTWDMVDLETGVIRKTCQKTGATLTIPMHRRLLESLKPYHGTTALVCQPTKLLTGAIWRRTKKLCGKTYLPRIFRRTFNNCMAEAGANDAVRAAIMGHTCTTMTTNYTKPSLGMLQSAVDLVPVFHDNAPLGAH